MDEIMRRKLLKSIGGSAFAATAFSGATSAKGSSDSDTGLGFNITKLDTSTRDQQIGEVWSAPPVKEMRSFLKKEHDIVVTPNDLEAFIVESSESDASFHLFRTPFEGENSLEADFVVRDLGDGAHASATVGTDVYKSTPSVTSGEGIQSHSPELEGYDIITGLEWSERKDVSSNDEITIQNNCDFSWEFRLGLNTSPPYWLCEAVSILGGLALTVLPEPTTSAAGVATLSLTAAGGGCTIGYTIEDKTGVDVGTNVVVCMNTSCQIDGFGTHCDFEFQSYLK